MLTAIWRAARGSLRTWVKRLLVRLRFSGLDIKGPSIWEYDSLDALEIGRGVWVGPFTEIVAYAQSHRSKVPGKLVLRDGAIVSTGVIIRAAGGRIEVGEQSGIGQNCVVVACNHQITPGVLYLRSEWREDVTGVIIGANCWIGANTTLLPGIVIGDNAVVGAGSVLNKSVPAGELWAGVPARFIRKIG